jgi:hypothetical protein
MARSYRIRTRVGEESNNIQVKLEQDFDMLEILSLKFSQAEVYTRMCADYGVVVGRITSNHGFGIPNAKVSIFIPLSEEDEDDPVISTLYPWKSVSDRNEDGYRYNLLPYKQSHSGHAPTGTFPDKTDVLYREEVLEIYEKYYKFTAKTNAAGDFMIWGVPTGTHTVHVDADLSDIGCFSIRPFDLMQQGVAQAGQFENGFKYKSSVDIDSLPQIIKFDKSVEVVPFWGHEDMCQIGITRTDFDFSELGISLQPTALFIGSMVTDSGKLATKKNGKPRKRQGFKCKLETYEGEVEAIRFTGRKYKDADGNYYPELEKVILDKIDENGTWMCSIPMNMEYIITNEFGDEEFTNDPNKGVATSAIYRFRIGFDFSSPKMEVGYYLVPNIREFNGRVDGKLNEADPDTKLSYTFSDDFDDYFRIRNTHGQVTHQNTDIRDLILGKNNDGVPEDYFYKFTYNKVYGVSSFHGTHFEGSHRDAFIGIKEILPNDDQDCEGTSNKFPINFGYRNRINFMLIVAIVLLFFKFIMKMIHIKIVEIVGGAMYSVGKSLEVWPVKRPAQKLQHAAIKWQEAAQIELPLTVYPICEECGQEQIEETSGDIDTSDLNGCVVASGQTTLIASTGAFGNLNLLSIQSANFFSVTPNPTTCPSATAINYASLGNLHNQFLNFQPDEGGNNRYAIAVMPMTGSSENAAVLLLSNPGYFFQQNSGQWKIFFADSDEAIEFGSEIDSTFGNGYNNNGISSAVFKFEIYDLQGAHTDDVPAIPEYQIESGCDKYDKFYDETLLYPSGGYIWGTKDSDYGSPRISITDQNSSVVTSGATYGSGTYPAAVLRYTSYSDVARTIEITGLDPTSTYTIKLVGSKRFANPSTEATVYTIGGISKTLAVANNLNNSTSFTTIQPIVDKITIGLDKELPSHNYNHINGMTITRNGAGIGSGVININFYGGIDPHNDTAWNNFSVGLGQQNNIEMFNLTDTLAITTGVNIAMSFSLNVATNDVVSQYQKIYQSTTNASIVASPPYSVNDYSIIAAIGAASSASPLPNIVNYSKIGTKTYERKTKTGFTEIRNGVVTIVPIIRGKSNNISILKEWYHRNQVSTAFCGGVVNHSFIDNWLTGTLYAFKFQFRKGVNSFVGGILYGRSFKYPRELVYYDGSREEFYYRSTPFDKATKTFIGQRNYYGGKAFKEILRPTTISDLGPRDEFIDEICTDKRVDPNCSVIRDITTTSYQNVEEIIEYAINYRMDVSNSKFKVRDFFNRSIGGVKLFDGDIVQLESINCETGIEEFDLDSPKYYMYNGELLDPEDPVQGIYFRDVPTSGNTGPLKFGPTPIDFKLDDNGRQVRLCLNHPDFLGRHSQSVPFYLWDKKGEGFGVSKYGDEQGFKKDLIVVEKLQRIFSFNFDFDYIVTGVTDLSKYTPAFGKKILVMTSGNVNTPQAGQKFVGNGSSWVNDGSYVKETNYKFPDGTEEYILYPMTKEHDLLDFNINGVDAMERFDFVSTNPNDRFTHSTAPEGTLFLHVVNGTINDPLSGFFYVMKANAWEGPFPYNRNEDDVFISPTTNNYKGNLQVLSTPFQYYFGLRPGKSSFDRFITAFGYKDAFKNNG